jgi:hypothetical protein
VYYRGFSRKRIDRRKITLIEDRAKRKSSPARDVIRCPEGPDQKPVGERHSQPLPQVILCCTAINLSDIAVLSIQLLDYNDQLLWIYGVIVSGGYMTLANPLKMGVLTTLALAATMTGCSPTPVFSPVKATALLEPDEPGIPSQPSQPDQPGQPSLPSQPSIPTTPDQVEQRCSQSTVKTQSIQVSFEDPVASCAWNMNGNLGPRDGWFQARTEQDLSFELPASSSICGVEFDFDRQSFYFDDVFMMALDGYILSAAYDFRGILESSNELLKYDWSRIAGYQWGGNDSPGNGVFCAGQETGDGVCSWPATQVEGDISMRYSPAIIQKITALTAGAAQHKFSFITTGDNDSGIDCRHKPVQFSVVVKYVE